MTHFSTNSLWLPKAGNTSAEYEDAFSIGKSDPNHPPRAAIAIGDGATEGMLSRQWANLLVRRFVRFWLGPAKLDAWLTDTLRAWRHEKRSYLRRRKLENKPIQWYEEPGLEAGAFAALLGFVMTRPRPKGHQAGSHSFRWTAAALGDCCVFQVRAGACIHAFPVTDSRALTSRPFLLSSNPARNRGVLERFQFAEGGALTHDRFYFMTDALASWFLREHEGGAAPWEGLDSLIVAHPPGVFANWIGEARAGHALRNDDVTLIRFEIMD